MRRLAQALALTVTLLAGLLAAVPTAAQPSRKQVALFTKAQLTRESVLGLLLLLISEETARVHEQLEALYEAGYIATAPGGSGAVGPYLAAALVSRYGAEAGDDVMAALLEYQRLIAREARQDRPSPRSRLVAATVRIAAPLDADEGARFVGYARDWLGTLEESVRGLGEAELDMLGLQELISQRQQALVLTTNLIKALNEAADAIVGNIGGGGSAPPAGPATSLSEGEEGGAVPRQGCRACP